MMADLSLAGGEGSRFEGAGLKGRQNSLKMICSSARSLGVCEKIIDHRR